MSSHWIRMKIVARQEQTDRGLVDLWSIYEGENWCILIFEYISI